jgi:Fe2+ transport system protein FeoA
MMSRKQLSSLIDGDKGKIVKIRGEAATHRSLLAMGLFVGRKITVKAIEPAFRENHVKVRVNGGFLSLEKEVAANIQIDLA